MIDAKIKTKNLETMLKGKSSTTTVSLDFIRGELGDNWDLCRSTLLLRMLNIRI